MIVVGLTGGIASGKTTVSSAFAERGVPIIDTDLIARELVEPDKPAFHDIVNYFRPNSLLPNGQIDRAWLRQHIFADETARRLLEAILHPPIYETVCQRLEALRTGTTHEAYVIVVIPLLAEHPEYLKLLDRVLVVDTPEDEQRQRLIARDGVSQAEAQQILAQQASRQQRLAIASETIDNSADAAALPLQVATLDQYYRQINR